VRRITAAPLLVLLLALIAGAQDTLDPLLERLAADDPLERWAAARELGARGEAARGALPALLERLRDPESWVRLEAGRAVVRVGARKRDVPDLVKRLDEPDHEVAQIVAEALAGVGASATPALLAALESDERVLRRNALLAIELLGRHAAAAAPRVLDLVFDADASTRNAAARALRRVGGWAADYVPDLVDRLQFGDEKVKWVAARVLGGIGPAAKAAVPALRELLASDSARVKEAAAGALKRIAIAPRREPHPALLDPARAKERAPERFRVAFETTKGRCTVELVRTWSPHGVDRVFNLVRIGFFDDTAFFRVLKGFVAQFGLNGDSRVSNVWSAASIPDDPRQESNVRGTLCFAQTSRKDSRTTQLFFNLGDNGRLDAMGFTPIGRVVDGMDVIDALFSGYGDARPGGEGPDQRAIQSMGNEHLKREFPMLDYIRSARVVEEKR
jgi:peptidyl-prolyl cis-trans isomerase A (cyclophilin A)